VALPCGYQEIGFFLNILEAAAWKCRTSENNSLCEKY